MAEPILKLSTIYDLPEIEIDGVRYKLRTVESMTLSQVRRCTDLGAQLDAYRLKATKRRLTKKDEQAVSLLLAKLVGELVEAPPSVLAKLRDPARAEIIAVFILLQSRRFAPPATSSQTTTAAAATTSRTGGKRSHGSRRTTRAS